MQVFEAIQSRRSFRKFLPTPVSRSDMEEIMHVSVHAPSAQNQQPWSFYVCQDSKKIQDLGQAIEEIAFEQMPMLRQRKEHLGVHNSIFFDASTVVFVAKTTSPKMPTYADFDCGLATENVILAATAKGLQCIPVAGPIFFGQSLIKEALAIPDSEQLMLAIPMGYGDPAGRAADYQVDLAAKVHWI
ncbi:putative nitroreductase family protein [Paratrimastix pyriformis]|uniref:Nitroreductase family protein n=1 Tax=Paratrimastix pyriformis TaxID=342808 RepID=A0ABQ8UFY8_9EUKA|nr:putative nitroreductase family protein [Paratrimastix pyriformis]